VTTLNLQLALSRRGVVIHRSTENLDAYDYVLRGAEYITSFSNDGLSNARQMFEKALALDPKYAAAYALLAFDDYISWIQPVSPDLATRDRGFQMAQRAAALDDSLSVAHGVLALFYAESGQDDRALSEAERAIGLDASSAFGYISLAHVLNLQRKATEALAAVEKAMRLDPRNPVPYLNHEGWSFTLLGRWNEAIHALKTYSVSYPDDLWPHAWLAIDYFNAGNAESAQAQAAQVERAIVLNPSSAVGYSALAFVLNGQGKPVEALAEVEKGKRHDPANRMILLQQAAAYSDLGRWQDSLDVLRVYISLYPDDIWAHAALGRSLSAAGNMNAARAEAAEIKRAVALDPQFDFAYDALAELMNDTGKPADALSAAERERRLNPSASDYLYEQGRAFTQLGRWQEGISSIQGFLAHHPARLWPHLDLVVDYIELGQAAAARDEVAEVLKINPRFSLKAGADLRKAGLV
jgi:tetratricopeptide (TPR) repeat protein